MRSIKELRAAVGNASNEEQVREIIDELSQLQDVDALPLLLEILNSTPSSSIRNAAAMGLKDLGDKTVVPDLMKHITNPENTHTNGTLIYAIEALDAREFVSELAIMACNGDYETISMVLNAVESFQGPLEAGKRQEALDILGKSLGDNSYPEWKREMLSELYEIIDESDAV